MKPLLLSLALIGFAPVARAQVYPQPPAYPGLGVPPPYAYAPARPEYYEGERRREEIRREEIRHEEIRHEEWVREHCFRDFRGEVVCRR